METLNTVILYTPLGSRLTPVWVSPVSPALSRLSLIAPQNYNPSTVPLCSCSILQLHQLSAPSKSLKEQPLPPPLPCTVFHILSSSTDSDFIQVLLSGLRTDQWPKIGALDFQVLADCNNFCHKQMIPKPLIPKAL